MATFPFTSRDLYETETELGSGALHTRDGTSSFVDTVMPFISATNIVWLMESDNCISEYGSGPLRPDIKIFSVLD